MDYAIHAFIQNIKDHTLKYKNSRITIDSDIKYAPMMI